MISETGYSTIVAVSITGAGLILAIYALIIPISRRMFVHRALLLHRQIEQFEEKRNKLTPDASSKEFKRLQQISEGIKDTRDFPKIFSLGVFAAFLLYMTSVFVGISPLLNPVNKSDALDGVLTLLFFSANSVFLMVGIFTTAIISSTMRKEYERVKKLVEKSFEKMPNNQEMQTRLE